MLKNMRLAVFSYLKTTVEAVVKPQKQITIKTTGFALQQSETGPPSQRQTGPGRRQPHEHLRPQ